MKQKMYTLFVLLFVILFTDNTDAQVITRFAGYDTSAGGGYGGDGGLAAATSVKMSQPVALAIDATGNVFIAEGSGNRIRMVAAGSGIIYTVCGNGTAAFGGDGSLATTAKVSTPRGLSIDRAGNLVIADANNNRIREISCTTGIITTIAGTGTPGYGGDNGPATAADFYIPTDAIYDAAGNLYVCDYFNNAVRKINTANIITTIAGTGDPGDTGDGGPATKALLHFPKRLALDAAGNLFITDGNNNSIRKVDVTTGIISTVAGSPTGMYGSSGDGGPATAALLNSPTSMKFDAAGNMYIADASNERIRKVSATTGIINTIAGINGLPFETGDGGLATAATLNTPYDIALDAANNLYIADFKGQTVRKVNTSPGLGTRQYSTLNNEIALFPNPNKGTFSLNGYLSTVSDENVSFTITNMLGQVMYTGNTVAHHGHIEEQVIIDKNFNSGLYLLQLKSGTETTIIRFSMEK